MTTRALVLGGGGPVGIAWEAGLIAGLADRGVDLAGADYIVGTSAGSFVGAQLALGRTPQELMQGQTAAARRFAGSERAAGPPPNTLALMAYMQDLASGERPLQEVRRDVGKMALATETMAEEQFVNMMSAMQPLPEDWPTRRYACTAIDALTGEQVVWDNDAGVPLSRAVTSSCAVPGIYPPITLNGRRYYDGGIGSATNSTVARGHDRVLVVAVTGGANAPTEELRLMRERMLARFEAELQEVRDSGSTVELVRPDEAAIEAFGPNLMDASRRSASAEAGLAQGRAEAERIAAFWNQA